MSHTYLFNPNSPLVLRTGRPFDQAGDPISLNFPLPSTLAGACRTAMGDEAEPAIDYSQENARNRLLETAVHGPLAAIIDNGNITPLLPKPADAVYLKQGKTASGKLYCLMPGELAAEEQCDLPQGLQPLFLEQDIKSKPVAGCSWWSIDNMTQWLLGSKPTCSLSALGWSGPQLESRCHVALEPETLSATDGQLFQTQGLDFGSTKICEKEHLGWHSAQYGMLAHLPKGQIQSAFRRLGGEGRLAHIEQADTAWPSIPAELEQRLKRSQHIRLVLVTPALFIHGWRPAWIDKTTLQGSPPNLPDITLKLCATANQRWEAVSGWDLAKNRPRAVRRMAPPGSVYWFEVIKGEEHLSRLWLNPVSDQTQNRLDGFGLAIPGIWEKTT
ncbi:MAG: type III-B CRISPR module-associated protein Cmr3 [Candidatus Polarisedimenticolaceae bacterium]|nr:type III-B CRISPR module-associated protein Cmr3 [Candidatus Polarisedimenticolaceae bacterium]